MNAQTNSRRDTCLMHGMADRIGVDVEHAAHAGQLSRGEREAMITRCADCTRHDACILWMMEHQGAQEATPPYCLNTNELNYLRALKQDPTS